jgi:hypothetical protein
MDMAKVTDALEEITRLQAEVEAARRAPPSQDERLAVAKVQLDHAGEQFRQQPFRISSSSPSAVASALMGAMQALAPASALEAVEKAIRAGPPGLDTATKVARIAAAEAKISTLVRSLSSDDLRQMTRERDQHHTHLRALRSGIDELQQACDRRTQAMADFAEGREELRQPPRRVSYDGQPPDLSRTERDIAGQAADAWLREAERELAADIRTLGEVRARYTFTAGDWRRCCLWVEQLERLLPVLPAPQQGMR